jgi:hypothetical protein
LDITWVDKNELSKKAVNHIRTVDIALDIGCGIMPQNFIVPLLHICCEPYDEYLDYLSRKIKLPENKGRDYLVLKMGWQDVVKYFPLKSVDTIFLVDVIEHLDKDEGKKLLLATQEIARHQVVVFTPLGFMPQEHHDGIDAWGLSGAAWQEHKSGWLPEDFEGDGWKFFASKEFHTTDNLGSPLKKIYGAFWAIKTNTKVRLFTLIRLKTVGEYKKILNKLRRKVATLIFFQL